MQLGAGVRHKISDAGINGVAVLDGIYQPGETVLYDVTLKNFSTIKAQAIKLTLDSGETVTLPALPANSVTTIKGAIKPTIKKRVGNRESRKLVSNLTLTAATNEDRKVQGRHFYNRNSGQINTADIKTVQILYPLEATTITKQGEIILNMQTYVNNWVEHN